MLSLEIEKRLSSYLAEDIGSGDITSSLLPSVNCFGFISSNEKCYLSGVEEVLFLFKSVGLKAKALKSDGSLVKVKERVLEFSGSNKKVLSIERVCLNILGRMSGVATLCAKARMIVERHCKRLGCAVPLLAVTRKTSPGFQLLDKKAAESVGVWSHRKNLSDMILLKDNHLVFFDSVESAVKKALSTKRQFEVEVKTDREAFEAVNAGAEIIMLDNFSVKKAKETILRIRRSGFKCKIELSGGINLRNLKNYCGLGADIISLGYLTKKARIVDFSLDISKSSF
ncbi:MAG: carboxylating nicotinate-nucleotide diphosphorylase [Candidatus Diapherotrites archaeon]